MEATEVIKSSFPRIYAIEKVTGKVFCGGDLKMQGMLCGKVLRSLSGLQDSKCRQK